MSHRIGFLLFDQFNLLDVSGPLEVFDTARQLGGCDYEIILLGEHQQAYQAESKIAVLSHVGIHQAPPLDTLVIPGGPGARLPRVQQALIPWILAQSHNTRRICSICTGAFLLAESGLLNGLHATTHWQFETLFKSQFPRVTLRRDSRYVCNGQISTSAGVCAGIDLALMLVADDGGVALAQQVAKYLLVPCPALDRPPQK